MDTMNTEPEKQDEIASAIHAIYKARAIIECLKLACDGMRSDVGVAFENTAEVVDVLLDEAMSALRRFQKANGVMGQIRYRGNSSEPEQLAIGRWLAASMAGPFMPNIMRTSCYHFATESGSTRWNRAGWIGTLEAATP